MISIVLCQYCDWKFVGDLDNSDLIELKNDTMSSKKYRCKKCGRAVTPRPAKDPQQEVDRKIEEEKINQEKQNWIQENIDFRSKFLEETSE